MNPTIGSAYDYAEAAAGEIGSVLVPKGRFRAGSMGVDFPHGALIASWKTSIFEESRPEVESLKLGPTFPRAMFIRSSPLRSMQAPGRDAPR